MRGGRFIQFVLVCPVIRLYNAIDSSSQDMMGHQSLR